MVNERCSRADHAFPRAMKRLQILLLSGFDRNEPHRRSQSGFVNSLRIRRIVLGPLHEGLHETRIDQQDPVAIGQKASAPKMCARASLHGDGFRTQFLDRLKQFGAARLTRNDNAILIDAVAVKRALPEVDGEQFKRHGSLLCGQQCWRKSGRRPSHNMKTAVETIFLGKDRQYNRRFLQMCSHHLVEPVACTPASGWEKGQVENQVGLVRERFFTPRLRFKSYDELNAWLLDKCLSWAKAHAHPERPDQTIWEVFEEERPKLIPYRGRFDGFHALPASVSKTCLVRFDNNKYSVSASAVGRPVDIHAYADRIVVRQDGRTVAEHPRCYGRGKTIYDPWHYVPVLARKPGALRNGAPFKDWVLPAALDRVRRKLAGSHDGDRQMVKILAAVLTDGLPAVEAACVQALAEGVHSADVVLNILARQRDPGPLEPITTPASLRLLHAPTADCARYDQLRSA